MGVKSWKKEFYPIEADKVGKEEAVEHCLRKWKGVEEENLDRHGVVFKWWMVRKISEEKGFEFSADNCALCVVNKCECEMCSLGKARGGVSCTRKVLGEDTAPWFKAQDGDAGPMIEWLEKAKKLEDMEKENVKGTE